MEYMERYTEHYSTDNCFAEPTARVVATGGALHLLELSGRQAPTIGISRPGAFFTAATLVMIAVRLFCSAMFDRYDKFRLSAAGLFCSACCYALLPLCASETQFHLLAIFTGLGWGIAMPLQAAAMFDISTPQTRAMNQNLMIIMMQGGFFLGPLAAGQLIHQYGFNLLFLGLAITTLLSAAMMAAINPPAKEDAACQK